ncbi:glycoside hydrolase family 2 protein [Flavihumibacter solisilvae]|uniref:glycoside hydrolase family 2 protein n=1 Tax=Flavihumibacter solisilvae TaxID=1349421 RepID=UPI001364B745|nr:glycoside hydrolase family 2 TIM barrel-domain containing protein [Flavihumibacter solisilvae]
MKKIFVLFFLVAIFGNSAASQHHDPKAKVDLGGNWTFALDPVRVGETQGWYEPGFNSSSFDKVKVPHCFSTDPRYYLYTGSAWYFREFTGSVSGNEHSFLRFDAVFYKAKVWVNGQLAGSHEGGYTPFELDITHLLKSRNTLAIQVDNSWDTTTIPGAKTNVSSASINSQQVYPWINYGGIIRPVYIIKRPAVFVNNVKITADPDLEKGSAVIRIIADVRNSSAETSSRAITAAVFDGDKKINLSWKQVNITVEAGAAKTAAFVGTMAKADVRLWNQDQPHLYKVSVTCGDQTVHYNFGIRKVEVNGVHVLLNGEPLKMGGCNRPLDYPGSGSMETDEVLQTDMQLIKGGSMELSRINHHAASEEMLDWADKNGLLIITEPGNWQLTPKQMSDTMMRRKFQQQMREMTERDWNHPSVIAYSVGNEFPSQTEEGRAWVRDMKDFVKSLDDSRLVTFASMIVFRDFIKAPEEEASQYVDFVSANIYGDHLLHLERIHKLYPGKPIYVSEFGWRTDGVKNEEERVARLKKAMQDFRKCDYLIGASVWTFNDYLSRFPGTNPNGYRPWGLVSPQREKRGMYLAWQEEFAPAVVELIGRTTGRATIKVTARKDFPSYTLRGYKLKCSDQLLPLNTLTPGQSQELTIEITGGMQVQLIKPGGFVILEKKL